MLFGEARLPRELGHTLNVAISLLMWRGLAVIGLGFAHWASALPR